MELSKAFDDKQNKLVNDISVGPGMHQLEESLRNAISVATASASCPRIV